MNIIADIGFNLDVVYLKERLGIDEDDEDDLELFGYLFAESCRVGSPKIIYSQEKITGRSAESIIIGGIEFCSTALVRNMDGVEQCYPYVVTCGTEIDDIVLTDSSPLTEYWRDEIKTELLMSARRYLNKIISEQYSLKHLSSMAPGSADMDVWSVKEQQKLFALFAGKCREIGVILTDSCLMLPNKSLSGIIFETEESFLSCQLCRRENCIDRKVGFDESLYEIMHDDDGSA